MTDIPDAAVEAPKLLPCPFCGDRQITTMVDAVPAVICENCGGGITDGYKTPDCIALSSAAWNRRALPHLLGEQICDGCGNTWSSDQLAAQKSANPKLLSCCPERKMLGLAEMRALLTERLARDAETARIIDSLSLQVGEQRAEIRRLRALLGRWVACPEVTEIDPKDRDPDTEQVWRETRIALGVALEPPGDG